MNGTGLLPVAVVRAGPLVLTDTLLTSLGVAAFLVVAALLSMRWTRTRQTLEVVYETLEGAVLDAVHIDARPLVPLVLTLWLFLGVMNLVGLIPGLGTPTRDLSIATSLALVAFFAGHVYALRVRGASYLRHYLQPSPFLLPFNLIGEVTRTVALALRLFGNMLSGHLVAAVLVYLVGVLLPVPLMLLTVLTAVVQAYIFGILTLVFAASSLHVADQAGRPAGSKDAAGRGETPPDATQPSGGGST